MAKTKDINFRIPTNKQKTGCCKSACEKPTYCRNATKVATLPVKPTYYEYTAVRKYAWASAPRLIFNISSQYSDAQARVLVNKELVYLQLQPTGYTISSNRPKEQTQVRLISTKCKECGSPGYKLEKVKPKVRLTSTKCRSCGSPGYKLEKA